MVTTDLTLIERDINELNARLLKLEKKGRFRRYTAYALKLVAGGSCLIIALDFFPTANQALGAAALICVFMDGVFANHERLLGEVQAGYAARAQRDKVARDYNRNLDPLLKIMKANRPNSEEFKAADAKKDTLQNETHTKLQDAVAKVEDALASLDTKALKALSLDTERAASSKP